MRRERAETGWLRPGDHVRRYMTVYLCGKIVKIFIIGSMLAHEMRPVGGVRL